MFGAYSRNYNCMMASDVHFAKLMGAPCHLFHAWVNTIFSELADPLDT